MRTIDADALKEHIDKLPALPDGNFAGNHSALKALINMQPTIEPEQNWIPCSERLPDNAYILGAFCPRYLVMTKWGISEGWFNPDHDGGMWNVLIWFFMGRYDDESDIDFCKGDKPKLMWLPKKFVIAWMPLPEPYKEEQE